ncbi:putative LOB domain-containing protein [Zostera marina]|uniref:Putative LOB domain-containing protein n=1 Tax=Zostera marina TaxID=29655 RepID=A0A0K9PAK3_ZOSMR|nr:putative LOB domain-containing protein [Zostera marina]
MTGFGSPCGACKFLRRKCVRGCVFAPYFCHEQGATHFAAIHKVFGASNVSKLLSDLPLPDRCEAAVTISYEAQARIQDPIYGCVSHIFALQQQVANLQAQLANLIQEQAVAVAATAAVHQNIACSSSLIPEENKNLHNKFQMYQQQDLHGVVYNNNNNSSMDSDNLVYDYCSGLSMNNNNNNNNNNGSSSSSSSCANMGSFDILPNKRNKSASYQDLEDLQSVAYAYLQR